MKNSDSLLRMDLRLFMHELASYTTGLHLTPHGKQCIKQVVNGRKTLFTKHSTVSRSAVVTKQLLT